MKSVRSFKLLELQSSGESFAIFWWSEMFLRWLERWAHSIVAFRSQFLVILKDGWSFIVLWEELLWGFSAAISVQFSSHSLPNLPSNLQISEVKHVHNKCERRSKQGTKTQTKYLSTHPQILWFWSTAEAGVRTVRKSYNWWRWWPPFEAGTGHHCKWVLGLLKFRCAMAHLSRWHQLFFLESPIEIQRYPRIDIRKLSICQMINDPDPSSTWNHLQQGPSVICVALFLPFSNMKNSNKYLWTSDDDNLI